VLQMGGSDQWGNIVAGADLIRRMKGGKAYGLTFPLIVTSSGEKMGKTAKGAVWLDPERTSPYEYYQFWINTADQDVGRFLALYTFLPMAGVRELSQKQGADLREVKEILAMEATTITHGRDEAEKARETSRTLFSGQGLDMESVPTSIIAAAKLEQGIEAYQLLVEAGICQTRGEARRLIAQGGAALNEQRIPSFDFKITTHLLKDNTLLMRIGKKRFHKIIFS
jgi:tyrosyl-tRNA synthetase